jgi:hypothetical protein
MACRLQMPACYADAVGFDYDLLLLAYDIAWHSALWQYNQLVLNCNVANKTGKPL